MNKLMKHFCIFILAFVVAFSSMNMTAFQGNIAYAAEKSITRSTQIVCNNSAKIKVPKGFKKCKFSSSNPKVATVNAKGKVKAIRLGVTTITVKSGTKKKKYKLTVIPSSKRDINLAQTASLLDQNISLKIASNKYDLSQVKVKINETDGRGAFDANGKCPQIENDGYYIFTISYGTWAKEVDIYVYSADSIFYGLVYPGESDQLPTIGVTYSYTDFIEENVTPSDLEKLGIELYVDNQPVKDQMSYSLGVHTFCIKQGDYEYTRSISLHYDILTILEKQDATGVRPECKEVLDTIFSIINQIITPNMTDEQKVKAIHDYLIYNANYYNNGDYSNAEPWAYGAEGVLLHHEGVCASYAYAFLFLAKCAGLDCDYLVGDVTKSNAGHAWNSVKVDGEWYYIDCTWDDPTGGGAERYKYYLSKELWPDHIMEEGDDSSTIWEYAEGFGDFEAALTGHYYNQSDEPILY